jgi:transketolase
MEEVAVENTFGQSGPPETLMKHYGLDKNGILRAVRRVLERKG